MQRMIRRTTLDSHIKDLRFQRKIHKEWSPSDLRPFLEGLFSKRTLSVYPNNHSASPDGLVRGYYVKRGMPAKYIRLGQARFVLKEEYSENESDSIERETIKGLSKGFSTGTNPPRLRLKPWDEPRTHLFEKRLLDVFPTKEVLVRYAGLCVEKYRPNSDSFKHYHSLIDQHRKSGITLLLSNPSFLRNIYETLIKWDMNYRNAILVEFSDFTESIKEHSKKIVELADYSMGYLDEKGIREIRPSMRYVFENLKVMQSESRIVGVPKTLHFLLPRLVMPIDGKYTLNFFYGYRPYRRSLSWECRLFLDIFEAFSNLTIRMGLSRSDEEAKGWNTTVPKIIDNAIIGYMRLHRREALQKRNP